MHKLREIKFLGKQFCSLLNYGIFVVIYCWYVGNESKSLQSYESRALHADSLKVHTKPKAFNSL